MKTATVLIAIALAGCAAPRPAEPPRAVTTTAPVCSGKAQCEAMWTLAQQGVELAAGMRVQLVTDGRIVTYQANDYNRMGGEVVRAPVGPDAYELRVSFSCYRGRDYCDRARPPAIDFFNLYVTNRARIR